MFRRRIAFCVSFFLISVGVVRAQALPPTALTVLYRFSVSNFEVPTGRLIQAPGGTFYGELLTGGANGGGAIFSFSVNGQLQTLYSFGAGEEPIANANGSLPIGGLVFGSDGNLYGTTGTGGPSEVGTVFKVTTSGDLTTLTSFGGPTDGQEPFGGLYPASDGYLYGTTISGGNSWGTIFRVDSTAGSLQTVFAFPFDGSEGAEPTAALIQGSDGALYGTTRAGARAHFGSGGVFRLPLGGTATNLVSFPGDLPVEMGALIVGRDGAFYGLTSMSEVDGGFAYRINTDGVTTKMHSFGFNDSVPEGAYPAGALILASDGNFYGVTTGGGIYNNGVIFKMTSDGTVTTVHSFTDSEGDSPVGGLLEGQDGHLYGMTGGPFTHNPTLFKLALVPTAPIALQSTSMPTEVSLSWQADKGATTYSVYEGTASGSESTSAVLSQIAATSATITGLRGGTTYYFRVTATNEAGEGPPSAEVSSMPSSPPGNGGGGSFSSFFLWLLAATCAYRIAFLVLYDADGLAERRRRKAA
jgi:uncharacterized repeat protein (TIGR03803 family)